GRGDERARAESGLDLRLASPRARRLLRHDEDDDAGVARRVARLAGAADAPLAPDLERDLVARAALEVGERNDHDLATGFRAHLVDDDLDLTLARRFDHVREIVHVTDRLRQIELRRG